MRSLEADIARVSKKDEYMVRQDPLSVRYLLIYPMTERSYILVLLPSSEMRRPAILQKVKEIDIFISYISSCNLPLMEHWTSMSL